ncbi:MFS transporter [Bradyrhizobium sp. NP1]|uniref:MFS transporter n=1 Tax=Bradyrhizobium sp. NP1 TaxID=3049772 RepID=UPI0025A5AA5B|nr:MFS transporter [Bradyrhizobium sp. NP1]WJR76881.1 MFS transporter [Bradyrhizobium sp. NP1]
MVSANSGEARSRITGREWRVIALATFGYAIEYYDFMIYAVFAQYISSQMFPASDSATSIVQTFAVFAIGYLARPLGGVILGHFGDRYGRRGTFLFSLLLVSLATLGMGLVPGYAQIGVLATLVFTALRLVQGVCLGGVGAGALTYCVEVVPRRAGFACGLLFCLTVTGVIIANLVSSLVHHFLAPADVAAYGWRLAFVLGCALGIVALLVRRNIEESPEFLRIQSSVVRSPFSDLIRSYRPQLLVGICIVAPNGILGGLLFAYMPVYLAKVVGYDPAIVPTAITLGSVVLAIFAVVYGWMSDLINRRLLYRIGMIALMVGAWPAYSVLAAKSADPVLVVTVSALFLALVTGTVGPLLADLFPSNVRFSAYGFCYNVSNAIFQGLAPLVATYLIQANDLLPAPAFCWIGGGVIGLLASFWIVALRRSALLAESSPAKGAVPVAATPR